MRAAIQDSFREKHGRKVRPSAIGVEFVPADEEAMTIVRQLADQACEGASNGIGFFPGSSRASAITRYGLELGLPEYDYRRGVTAPQAQSMRICEKFFNLANAHPMGAARLRRAVWLAIVAHQANVRCWERPEHHYIGVSDPDFVRACRVAAARMLSQRKLWQVVRRPDNKAGLIRVDYPDSFWG